MARQHKIHLRQSPKNKQFYTRIVAPNGEPVFDGCEGYVKKKDAEAAITKLTEAIKAGNFKVVDDSPAAPAKDAGKKPAPKESKKVPVTKKQPKKSGQMSLPLSPTVQ